MSGWRPPRGSVGIGLIGAGMVSDTYLAGLTRFPDVGEPMLGDLAAGRARAQTDPLQATPGPAARRGA